MLPKDLAKKQIRLHILIQADLGTEHSVCAVATQGSFLNHEWL